MTGSGDDNDGKIDVWVDLGSGYVVATSGQVWSQGETVVDYCYATLRGVQVRGPTMNAWAGSILLSEGGGAYSPLYCTGCTGTSVFKNHSDGGWHGLLQIIAGEILRQAQELHCEELRSMEADIAARTVDGARAPDDDTRACRACERLLPRASFSKKQWSSAAKRRCIECVETGAEAPRPAEIGETVETPFEDIEPFRVAGFDARTS